MIGFPFCDRERLGRRARQRFQREPCLVQIALASQGAIRWSKAAAQAVVQDCDLFEAWLNQSPITHKTPEEFWNTPVGYMVLRARLWAEKDKLISVTEAADISGLSISTLSQRISRGTLMGYNDPFEHNPRRSRRIRLSTIHQLLNQGGVTLKHLASAAPKTVPVAKGKPEHRAASIAAKTP